MTASWVMVNFSFAIISTPRMCAVDRKTALHKESRMNASEGVTVYRYLAPVV